MNNKNLIADWTLIDDVYNVKPNYPIILKYKPKTVTQIVYAKLRDIMCKNTNGKFKFSEDLYIPEYIKYPKYDIDLNIVNGELISVGLFDRFTIKHDSLCDYKYLLSN